MSNTSLPQYNAEQLLAQPLVDLCEQLKQQISSYYADEPPVLVGIHRGGFYLAEWLHASLGLNEPVGGLDISWHRDDLRASSVSPHVKPTRLPVDIDGREVLLIDDVLYTGRTIRAALNELFDYGRPAAVRLAVLAQRSGRELPVAADFAACEFELPSQQELKLLATAKQQLLPVENWQWECVDKEEDE
ncbi:MAG: bifunctional pyr operon transcriptional regulator/uracil phosphoribosyltransferase PyrR [Gammaproteobacteria bacterium]|nr:bifunctional pyr operon transcriptional regulator/uracil phosphoribosyltransferase PyrR [Gammaproteobacteria bacterium]